MYKTKKKFPEFVDPFPPIDEKQQIWINLRSFGNLTIPSQVLVDNIVNGENGLTISMVTQLTSLKIPLKNYAV